MLAKNVLLQQNFAKMNGIIVPLYTDRTGFWMDVLKVKLEYGL